MKGWLAAAAVRALGHSWRVRVEGTEHLAAARARGPVLFAPWHESLIPLVWHHRHRGITLLVGRHADAGVLATAAATLGYALARGSSSRGGAAGLRTLVRALSAGGDGAVTPDGPRGPRRAVKPGVLHAARAAGATVLPVGLHVSSAWHLASWDRMVIPRPGATVTIRYGPGLRVPDRADPRGDPADGLQAALDALALAS